MHHGAQISRPRPEEHKAHRVCTHWQTCCTHPTSHQQAVELPTKGCERLQGMRCRRAAHQLGTPQRGLGLVAQGCSLCARDLCLLQRLPALLTSHPSSCAVRQGVLSLPCSLQLLCQFSLGRTTAPVREQPLLDRSEVLAKETVSPASVYKVCRRHTKQARLAQSEGPCTWHCGRPTLSACCC